MPLCHSERLDSIFGNYRQIMGYPLPGPSLHVRRPGQDQDCERQWPTFFDPLLLPPCRACHERTGCETEGFSVQALFGSLEGRWRDGFEGLYLEGRRTYNLTLSREEPDSYDVESVCLHRTNGHRDETSYMRNPKKPRIYRQGISVTFSSEWSSGNLQLWRCTWDKLIWIM